MEKDNNSARYIAGVCFVIVALIAILRLLSQMNLLYLAVITGDVLIAVSMFAVIPVLTAVGGGILAAWEIRSIVFLYRHVGLGIGLVGFGSSLIWLIVYILFVVMGLNKKCAKVLGIVAGVLLILNFVVYNSWWVVRYGGSNSFVFIDALSSIITIAGTFALGMALSTKSPKKARQLTAAPVPIDSQIDRLTKLKGLLDAGVISQAEFESKKQEILEDHAGV